MKLTREQIEEFMADRSVNEVCSDEEFKELCRLALTALSAEPVATEQKPFGYFCDWGDRDGLQRIAMYYGEPGSASIDDWNESPKVHRNLPLYAAPPSLLAENARLREALLIVLDDLMYKDHKRVIDIARAALREPK